MKKMYKIFTKFYRIELLCEIFANYTWMCGLRGGGRLEVTNHGRSRVKSFLQETEDKYGQQTPRNGVRPKQKSTVQDARDLKSDLPIFFCHTNLSRAINLALTIFLITPQLQGNSLSINRGKAISLEPKKPIVRGLNETEAAMPIYESEQSKKVKKKIRDVAELYEKQFLREMVKQMRSTVGYSEISKPSFAEGYFREQLDQEYVEKWGDQGGIGLGKMIYKQLLDQYGARMGATLAQPQIDNP